jgi:hypothetical protein
MPMLRAWSRRHGQGILEGEESRVSSNVYLILRCGATSSCMQKSKRSVKEKLKWILDFCLRETDISPGLEKKGAKERK